MPVEAPARRRPLPLRAIALLLVVSLLGVGGYTLYGKFAAGGSTSGAEPVMGTALADVEGFGVPVALDSAVAPTAGEVKLRGALFPVACTREQGSATGIAYVIALTGLEKSETGAFASASSLSACLENRVAYLHDGTSSLRVSIAAFDPDTGVVRLQIPAPLPAQAVRLVENAGSSLVASISSGVPTLTPESPAVRTAPGSPLLDDEGYAIGLVTAEGERITTGRLCGTLLSC